MTTDGWEQRLDDLGQAREVVDLHRMEWEHPRIGRIEETVCPEHERDVLRALRVLGIGCGGTMEYERTVCDRCEAGTRPPRVWLREPRP